MITIVTGLPRSGTSLMMQMLAAAGVPVLSDGARKADADNPHGYLEDARVMALHSNASWLGEARGRALKVVAPLLPSLPREHDYRVVWMQRDLDEVLASQARMLERAGHEAGADDTVLRRAFEKQVETARADFQVRGAPILDVDYARAVAEPLAVAREVCVFLGGDLDADVAAAVVDASL